MRLVISILFVLSFVCSLAWAQPQSQSPSYRETNEYLQNICVAEDAGDQETYLVSPYLLNTWQVGKRYQVGVLEFLTGKSYRIKLTLLSKEKGAVLISAGKKNLYLKCTGGLALPYRFQNGDTLDEIAIDRTGKIIDSSDLDRGTEAAFGLARYSVDGNLVWAKFLLARDARCKQDPWHARAPIPPFNTYGGIFYVGRIFSEKFGMIIFSSSVIQLNLENGEMAVPHKNILIVPLNESWRLLKDLKNRSPELTAHVENCN